MNSLHVLPVPEAVLSAVYPVITDLSAVKWGPQLGYLYIIIPRTLPSDRVYMRCPADVTSCSRLKGHLTP